MRLSAIFSEIWLISFVLTRHHWQHTILICCVQWLQEYFLQRAGSTQSSCMQCSYGTSGLPEDDMRGCWERPPAAVFSAGGVSSFGQAGNQWIQPKQTTEGTGHCWRKQLLVAGHHEWWTDRDSGKRSAPGGCLRTAFWGRDRGRRLSQSANTERILFSIIAFWQRCSAPTKLIHRQRKRWVASCRAHK